MRPSFSIVTVLPALLVVLALGTAAISVAPRQDKRPAPPPATTQPAPTSQPDGEAGETSENPNPHAKGFNVKGSDEKAIEIADAVMNAMGGRRAWDETRYFAFWFFQRRLHVWDKHTGDIRVEGVDPDGQHFVVLMNVNTRKGRAFVGGFEVPNQHTVEQRLDEAYRAWINDTYWLVMPYKLKDSGVTLKYLGEGRTSDDRGADILEMTFEGVGVTPANKYLVYVDFETRLVSQWDFFRDAHETEPAMSTPWTEWRRFGKIMLSTGRGPMDGVLSKVAVHDEIEDWVLSTNDPLILDKLGGRRTKPERGSE